MPTEELEANIDHYDEWEKWSAANRLARQKQTNAMLGDDEPFSVYAERVMEKFMGAAEQNAELYEKAELTRESVLRRYAETVQTNIHQSRFIPAYCILPRTPGVMSVEARTLEIEEVFRNADEGWNVFLTGGVGVGKTYAALQIVYRWCRKYFRYGFETNVVDEVRRGIPPKPCVLNFWEYEQSRKTIIDFPRFVNSKTFLHELRSTFDGSGSEQAIIDKYLAPPLLVFDDLGAEKTSDWTRDRVLSLLEMRLYNPAKQTIITTNLSISEKFGPTVSQVIDDRLASRIQEQCACFRLDGPDLRVKH